MIQKQTNRRQLKLLVLGASRAGKTSLLRRYFYKHFQDHRAPTVGSDVYVGKVKEFDVSIQMWDTPGKENENFKVHQNRNTRNALSDSFFEQADAIMLVYDCTASTSFTRLLKWYADLQQLWSKNNTKLPILVVSNKIDLFEKTKNTNVVPKRVPQRDVLGLRQGYYGDSFVYEYSVSPPNEQEKKQEKNDDRPSKYNKDKNNKRRMEISSYLVNRENWTSDGSYLESLLHSEDGSHPDREMVLVWCMRNALKFVECSAATGAGVNEAIHQLVELALQHTQPKEAPPINNTTQNQELDLTSRYAPKEDRCFSFLPILRL